MNKEDIFAFENFKNNGWRVELTAAVTGMLLYKYLPKTSQYDIEREVLEKLIVEDKRTMNGINLIDKTWPQAGPYLFNRYNSIKAEATKFLNDFIIIGAAGISPLGIVLAKQNPNCIVHETDLEEIVKYRNKRIGEVSSNYYCKPLNLLEFGSIKEYRILNNLKGVGTYIVEGFTFYLEEEQLKAFHRNLIDGMIDAKGVIISEYYTVKSQNKSEPTVAELQSPGEDYEIVFRTIKGNRKIKFEEDAEVEKLLNERYPNSVNYRSKFSIRESPQQVWVSCLGYEFNNVFQKDKL